MDDIVVRNSLKATLNPILTHKPAADADDKSFAAILKQSINEVNELQKEADKAILELTTGDNMSIHETVIALEKAEISFKLLMQVRNKIIEAYQEIMRMQI